MSHWYKYFFLFSYEKAFIKVKKGKFSNYVILYVKDPIGKT